MSISLANVKKRVAQKMGVLAITDALSAEDGSLLGEKCSGLQKQLRALDILTVDFNDGIDELYIEPIVSMLAAMAADDFMIREPKRSQLLNEGLLGLSVASIAERMLRKLLSKTLLLNPVKSEFF